MPDARLTDYAKLLVEDCIDVQPGWQVAVIGSHLGRPLIEEVFRQIALRGAYVIPRITFGEASVASRTWLLEALLDLLSTPAPIDVHLLETMDALVVIDAPENTRDGSRVPRERLGAMQVAYRPHMERISQHEVPWVGCQFPTAALAQDAGMSTDDFAEFLYGACLLDWNAERTRMNRYALKFDLASEVRLVGADTDLRLSLDGRSMLVDAAGANIPGGEFFGCPVEDSAEGLITFSEFPAVYASREISNIRLRFEAGRVVEASATSNEAYLLETLDQDRGARRLGELGIGCNPGITRYMKNTLFDEKMDGTVHLALGNGMPYLGGTNVSTIHWDIVKDLRTPGSRIELDGNVVQQDGTWLIEDHPTR